MHKHLPLTDTSCIELQKMPLFDVITQVTMEMSSLKVHTFWEKRALCQHISWQGATLWLQCCVFFTATDIYFREIMTVFVMLLFWGNQSQAWEEAIWVKSRKQILKKPLKKPTKKPLKKPCRLLKAVPAFENVSLRPIHDWLVPTRKATSTFNNDTIDDGRRQESDECETKTHLWL